MEGSCNLILCNCRDASEITYDYVTFLSTHSLKLIIIIIITCSVSSFAIVCCSVSGEEQNRNLYSKLPDFGRNHEVSAG